MAKLSRSRRRASREAGWPAKRWIGTAQRALGRFETAAADFSVNVASAESVSAARREFADIRAALAHDPPPDAFAEPHALFLSTLGLYTHAADCTLSGHRGDDRGFIAAVDAIDCAVSEMRRLRRSLRSIEARQEQRAHA